LLLPRGTIRFITSKAVGGGLRIGTVATDVLDTKPRLSVQVKLNVTDVPKLAGSGVYTKRAACAMLSDCPTDTAVKEAGVVQGVPGKLLQKYKVPEAGKLVTLKLFTAPSGSIPTKPVKGLYAAVFNIGAVVTGLVIGGKLPAEPLGFITGMVCVAMLLTLELLSVTVKVRVVLPVKLAIGVKYKLADWAGVSVVFATKVVKLPPVHAGTTPVGALLQ